VGIIHPKVDFSIYLTPQKKGKKSDNISSKSKNFPHFFKQRFYIKKTKHLQQNIPYFFWGWGGEWG